MNSKYITKIYFFLLNLLHFSISDCLDNSTLSSFGFIPFQPTVSSNLTSCNKNWNKTQICIQNYNSFIKSVNPFIINQTQYQGFLMANMTNNFEALVQLIENSMKPDIIIKNETIPNFLLFPFSSSSLKKFFNNTSTFCTNSLQEINVSLLCNLVTSNASDLMINSTIVLSDKLIFPILRRCLISLRVYCMYVQFFNHTFFENKNHVFYSIFDDFAIGNCSSRIVTCANNYSNGDCDFDYKTNLIGNYVRLSGLRSGFELSQIILNFFGNVSEFSVQTQTDKLSNLSISINVNSTNSPNIDFLSGINYAISLWGFVLKTVFVKGLIVGLLVEK